MPCIDSSGDVFVSVPLPWSVDPSSEPLNPWLLVLGDFSGKGEPASRLKDALETEVIRLAGTQTDPASMLNALNGDLVDPAESMMFAALLVVVINSVQHGLTLANAGHVPPQLRSVDRRIVSIAEDAIGIPLWIDPAQTYKNVTVPVGPGEVAIFYSDGVTSAIDHQNHHFRLKSLRQAIAQAPNGAASVGQSILDAILCFGHRRAQMDDITLLCLGRTGTRNKK
jgi:sigma-B regulation protein RsbU (phosphoserine phosphatase)